ncbi:CaiB/BaiF CoA transferase family protein [Bauldia sp.]|uniref:CaiB/BaiF CoA transferase family protein n=1 Tax=Bauldia sp. TaxID=2575872 RepID=UPI003BAAD30D
MSGASDDTGLLSGLLVVDFSQFLAGPLAGLKLADFGARVIKIERPGVGDLCRNLYLSEIDIGNTNTLFHAINRNKQSYAADLKSEVDREKVMRLVAKADIVIQNFRPGIIERLGLDYESVKAFNPGVVYASVSGFGAEGEWRDLPGQDLLAQARSGIMWLTGDADHPPVPIGLAIADQLAGNFVVQGVLAALVRRAATGKGAHIETSLLEAVLDFQFEVLTTHLNDPDRKLPRRSGVNNAHAYLAAPYGVYQTSDGHVAIAMTPVDRLGRILGCEPIADMSDPQSWFDRRDEIKALLRDHLAHQTTAHWMERLKAEDVWASEVLDWPALFETEGFATLDFLQRLDLGSGQSVETTRSPVRVDGDTLTSPRPAPAIGEHNAVIDREFGLDG